MAAYQLDGPPMKLLGLPSLLLVPPCSNDFVTILPSMTLLWSEFFLSFIGFNFSTWVTTDPLTSLWSWDLTWFFLTAGTVPVTSKATGAEWRFIFRKALSVLYASTYINIELRWSFTKIRIELKKSIEWRWSTQRTYYLWKEAMWRV